MFRRSFLKGLLGLSALATISTASVKASSEQAKNCCSGCGKSMVNPETKALNIALSISRQPGQTEAADKFAREQFGRFKREQYNFCWECCLVGLGAKPG